MVPSKWLSCSVRCTQYEAFGWCYAWKLSGTTWRLGMPVMVGNERIAIAPCVKFRAFVPSI